MLFRSLDGYPIRREGSQGQNKSYLVALKLAQYRLLKETCNKSPILLLDDIFDRLDAVRVGRIISLVSDNDKFGQVFITDVDRNHIDGILADAGCEYKVFTVEDGNVICHRRQPTRLPHPWDSPGKNTGVGCHFLLQCMKGKSESEVAQSCLTLRNPMDCSLPALHFSHECKYPIIRLCET